MRLVTSRTRSEERPSDGMRSAADADPGYEQARPQEGAQQMGTGWGRGAPSGGGMLGIAWYAARYRDHGIKPIAVSREDVPG